MSRDPFRPQFGDPVTPWRSMFAWRPVWTADAGWVWLCKVFWRRVVKHSYLDGGADLWWQYVRYDPRDLLEAVENVPPVGTPFSEAAARREWV